MSLDLRVSQVCNDGIGSMLQNRRSAFSEVGVSPLDPNEAIALPDSVDTV